MKTFTLTLTGRELALIEMALIDMEHENNARLARKAIRPDSADRVEAAVKGLRDKMKRAEFGA